MYLKDMDCDIPEGTWFYSGWSKRYTRAASTFHTKKEKCHPDSKLANYQEIVDAGGNAPEVGDWAVVLDAECGENKPGTAGKIFYVNTKKEDGYYSCKLFDEIHNGSGGNGWYYHFENIRPALSHEIPQNPEYRKNKDGEYHEFPSIKVDDVNRTHDNCRCVNISYDEAKGTTSSGGWVDTPNIKAVTVEHDETNGVTPFGSLTESQQIEAIEVDMPHNLIDTRIAEVVKPVLSRRTWDVMAVDGMPMQKTKPFYTKTEPYNNDNPDANWWKNNSFSKKAKEDAKKQWYHDMDGKC